MTEVSISGSDIIEACAELAEMLPGMTSADVHGAMCELSRSDDPADLAVGLSQLYHEAGERGMLVPPAARQDDGYVGLTGFQDSNGNYPVPPDESGWGVGSEVLRLAAAHPDIIRSDGPIALAGGSVYTDNADALPDSYPGLGGADQIAARHPGLFAPKSTQSGGRGRHRSGCPDDCTVDHNQPKLGGRDHPEVARLLRDHAGLAMFGRDGSQTTNSTTPVKSAAHRARERQAASSVGGR